MDEVIFKSVDELDGVFAIDVLYRTNRSHVKLGRITMGKPPKFHPGKYAISYDVLSLILSVIDRIEEKTPT